MPGEQERVVVRQPFETVDVLLRCELLPLVTEPWDQKTAGATRRSTGVVPRAR